MTFPQGEARGKNGSTKEVLGKAEIVCPHCGGEMIITVRLFKANQPKRTGRPPIGAKAMTSTKRARRTSVKAKRDGTVQFNG